MRRLVALIAILFAFASLGGTTTAHAHRYEVHLDPPPLVVLNHVDAENRSIPVIVHVHACGQIDLGNGIVLPCGSHQGIPVSAPQVPPAPPMAIPASTTVSGTPLWRFDIILRPPRLA